MKTHHFTCIKCPLSCQIELIEDNGTVLEIRGCTCNQGEQYALDEFSNPLRIVTTTVRVTEGILPVVPVRSQAPLPKSLIADCVSVLNTTEVEAPVTCGQIVCSNILDTGIDVVASRDLERRH
ncbi:MAG: DUF1667 domain-containing protein [Theionarchaea archaeon]|nr:DUF1667 domain-containing protein [Theionarchaea archaeon]MBU7037992.1 DUF1667 domain-containing protein [Theionarchaea archaeon]